MPLLKGGPVGHRFAIGMLFLVLWSSASVVFPSDNSKSGSSPVASPFPVLPGLPPPDTAAEAGLLAGLAHGRIVPFRAIRGGGGLDGTKRRPGEALTRSQLFAMFMDDISSVVRRAWSALLPQIRRALALAEEQKANASDPREGERLALKEKARAFSRLIQVSRNLVNEVVQKYKPLQNKNFFKYFTEHVISAVEFSLIFSLKLIQRPVSPVGDLAHLANDDEKLEFADLPDTETQILTPDGKLVPASTAVLQMP